MLFSSIRGNTFLTTNHVKALVDAIVTLEAVVETMEVKPMPTTATKPPATTKPQP